MADAAEEQQQLAKVHPLIWVALSILLGTGGLAAKLGLQQPEPVNAEQRLEFANRKETQEAIEALRADMQRIPEDTVDAMCRRLRCKP